MIGSHFSSGKLVIFCFCFGDRLLPQQLETVGGVVSSGLGFYRAHSLHFFVTQRFSKMNRCSGRHFVNNNMCPKALENIHIECVNVLKHLFTESQSTLKLKQWDRKNLNVLPIISAAFDSDEL